ncbi:MAG: FtsX-like permease family protein [Chlorobi bacterium]|nr:FtsX-like permease family protein [Chlorobiota bacterium]
MVFEFQVARRYLFGRKRFSFIRVISLLATLGITFGVAALIVVLSVFNGFGELVTSILQDFDPHVRVENPQGISSSEVTSLMEEFKGMPEVRSVAPVIQKKAMAVRGPYNAFITVKGVRGDDLPLISNILKKYVLGAAPADGRAEIGLGVALADKLHALVGDTVTLVSPAGMQNILTQFVFPTVLQCRVSGIFQSDNKMYDGSFSFIPYDQAQSLFRMPGKATALEMRLYDDEKSDELKASIEKQLGAGWNVLTWYDLHRDLYSMMKIERWAAFVILSLLIAVSGFNILASLTMMVIEKKRDIGVLRAMGANTTGIQRIFWLEGVYIGGIGAIAGAVLGLLLVWIQVEFEVFRLSSAFIIRALPVSLHVVDVIIIMVCAFLVSMMASIYPARRAGRLVPIEAIRWE